MLDHLDLTVSDLAVAASFYTAVVEVLGGRLLHQDEYGVSLGHAGGYLWLGPGQPQPFHFAFRAADEQQVRQFYQAALAAGGRDNGAPGPRQSWDDNLYYACYVIDPDGYRIECVYHGQSSATVL